MYAQGHTKESFDALPFADRHGLLQWWLQGLIGPLAESRMAYLLAMCLTKVPDFAKIFPAHANLLAGVDYAGPGEDELRNEKMHEWLDAMEARQRDRSGRKDA